MQSTTQTMEVQRTASNAVPREGLDVDILPPAMSITWKPRDWYWLNFFREASKSNPDNWINKLMYKNYLKWYRDN